MSKNVVIEEKGEGFEPNSSQDVNGALASDDCTKPLRETFTEALWRYHKDFAKQGASDTGKPWSDLVNQACWADRTVHLRTTGYTPCRLMMGEERVLLFDLEGATFMVRRGGTTV